MTDKVQKIREVIEKRYECWKEKELNSHSIESEIRMSECQHLLLMLDSLQEGPVNIWHDASENPKKEELLMCVYKDNRYHVGKIYKDEFNRLLVSDNKNIIELCMFEKWAYIEDLLNLSNVERTVKDLKEPVSEDLREAAHNYADMRMSNFEVAFYAFMSGAKWQKEHLWKSADGDDLPEIDREVIVLVKYSTQRNIHDEKYPTYRVEFGHRPNPKGWEGKSVTTGKVEHYTPKLYDKGGWNMPNVKYWLDCSMPKEIEL